MPTQVYLHSSDSVPKAAQRDKNFQGFGRFTAGSTGEYRFRTIKPVPYPGRPAPHIHFKVKKGGRELLTSQIFIAGFAGNKNDGVYRGAGDAFQRALVSTDFNPLKGSTAGRTGGAVRHCDRAHAGGYGLIGRHGARSEEEVGRRGLWELMWKQTLIVAVCGLEWCRRPGPDGQAAGIKDHSNSAIVTKLMAMDKNKDGKLTRMRSPTSGRCACSMRRIRIMMGL